MSAVLGSAGDQRAPINQLMTDKLLGSLGVFGYGTGLNYS